MKNYISAILVLLCICSCDNQGKAAVASKPSIDTAAAMCLDVVVTNPAIGPPLTGSQEIVYATLENPESDRIWKINFKMKWKRNGLLSRNVYTMIDQCSCEYDSEAKKPIKATVIKHLTPPGQGL